jgi:hypothetical protein
MTSSFSRLSALISSSFRLIVSGHRYDGCGRDNSSLSAGPGRRARRLTPSG